MARIFLLIALVLVAFIGGNYLIGNNDKKEEKVETVEPAKTEAQKPSQQVAEQHKELEVKNLSLFRLLQKKKQQLKQKILNQHQHRVSNKHYRKNNHLKVSNSSNLLMFHKLIKLNQSQKH